MFCWPQFLCNDGSIIGIDKRCNFVPDCEDKTDEDDCGECDFEFGKLLNQNQRVMFYFLLCYDLRFFRRI